MALARHPASRIFKSSHNSTSILAIYSVKMPVQGLPSSLEAMLNAMLQGNSVTSFKVEAGASRTILIDFGSSFFVNHRSTWKHYTVRFIQKEESCTDHERLEKSGGVSTTATTTETHPSATSGKCSWHSRWNCRNLCLHPRPIYQWRQHIVS